MDKGMEPTPEFTRGHAINHYAKMWYRIVDMACKQKGIVFHKPDDISYDDLSYWDMKITHIELLIGLHTNPIPVKEGDGISPSAPQQAPRVRS